MFYDVTNLFFYAMLSESQIKVAVIDYLFCKGMLENAVLINEMVIANWSRRADLAVANGRLYGFEIKSDLDSLKRLDGQLKVYVNRFDKVIVIVSTKWVSSVLESTPSQVEVWEARELETGRAEIKVVRRGQIREIDSSNVLCGYLHKPEIVSFLRGQGMSAETDMPRSQLVDLTKNTYKTRLRTHVLQSLKSRYANTFNAFLNARNEFTTTENLKTLSKVNLVKQVISTVQVPKASPENYRELDLNNFRQKYGPLPLEMPTGVLMRKVGSL